MRTDTWFEDALRPEVVAARVHDEVTDDGQAVTGCRITRIRSVQPEGAWTATYELGVRGADGAERTVVAQGRLTPPGLPLPPRSPDPVAFGEPGWTLVVDDLRLALATPPLDEELEGLALVLDPDRAPGLLTAVLRDAGVVGTGTSVVLCAPTVAAHKPGVRATVVCRLGLRGGPGPSTVVVKVHSDGQGAHGHDVLRALAATPLAESGAVVVPRPLAYVPGLHLSVQEHLEHHGSLKELFHTAFEVGEPGDAALLEQAVQDTGAALAALHRCGGVVGEAVPWEDELAGVSRKLAALAKVVPELAGAPAAALERLSAAAAAAPPDPLVPSHGSLQPAQVLLLESGVGLIDVDKACQSEPARDLAAFTAKVRHMAANKVDRHRWDRGGEAEVWAEALREAFLGAYRRTAVVDSRRLAVWEGLELVSLVLSAAKKMDEDRSRNCLAMLEEHLGACGI